MNKMRFDSLPPEQQEAITRAAVDAAMYERDLMREANEQARQTVTEGGATVTEIDNAPFQEAVQPIYEEFPDLMPLLERIRAAK